MPLNCLARLLAVICFLVVALLAPERVSVANAADAHVILIIQGIDSSGSCTDKSADFYDYRREVQKALKSSDAADAKFVGFSYSRSYGDSTSCSKKEPGLTDLTPIYDRSATCDGVEKAARHLDDLIKALIRADGGVTIDIVAHSMGGLVVGYYTTFADRSNLDRVHSVALLDSPLTGVPGRNPLSSCGADSQAWKDLQGEESDVIDRIQTIDGGACKRFSRFYAIASTGVGSTVPCAPLRYATVYTPPPAGRPSPTAGLRLLEMCVSRKCIEGLIELARFAWAVDAGHGAVWADDATLDLVKQAFNGSPRSLTCEEHEVDISAGKYLDLSANIPSSGTLVVSVDVTQNGIWGDIGMTIKVTDTRNSTKQIADDEPYVFWGAANLSSGKYMVRLDNTHSLLKAKQAFVQVCTGKGPAA